VYSSAVFAGVHLFALNFYLERVVPINHFWYKKTSDTGLPDSEDRIPLRSLVLTQYRSVTDRQTDGHTDKYAAAYTSVCKTSFAQRCNEISFDGFRFYTVSGKK